MVVEVYDEVSTVVAEEGAKIFKKEITKNPIATTTNKKII